ncbi:MAG: hypothetical protein KDC84_03480 [Crocinitomicaceae bacterium]|nr:hypothetical protein [Crocinitomicaceae bacterium]
MKNTFTIVSLLFLLNSFGQNLNFEILFGNYANDHFEKKFHVQERKWVLDNDQLSYSIDEHDTRYADTLTLTKEEQKRISDYVLKEGLNQNIEEEIEKDYLKGEGTKGVIKGFIQINSTKNTISLIGEALFLVVDTPNGKKLKELENILHNIVDNYGIKE